MPRAAPWNTAHTNSYNASYGATTTGLSGWGNNCNTSNYIGCVTPADSSGIFTYGIAYGFQSVTDGTSNTVAFAEKLCGQNGQNYYKQGVGPGAAVSGQHGVDCRRRLERECLSGLRLCQPRRRDRRPPDLRQTFRTAATNTGAGAIQDYPGWRWAVGMSGMSLINTVQVPNDTYGGCNYDTNGSPANTTDWPNGGFSYGAPAPTRAG